MLALVLAVALVPGRIGVPLYRGAPVTDVQWQLLRGLPMWSGLDSATGRLVAGPLARALGDKAPTPQNIAIAMAQAGPEAAELAQAAVAAAQSARSLGLEDLAELEQVLRGLSIYGGETVAAHQAVTGMLAMDTAHRIAANFEKKPVPGSESSRQSGLKKPSGVPAPKRAVTVPKAMRVTGAAVSGAALLPGMIWLLVPGLALILLGRLLAGPKASTPPPLPEPATGRLARYKDYWAQIKLKLDQQRHLSAQGSLRDWLMGGLRAAFYALPVALLALLTGAVFRVSGGGEASLTIMPLAFAAAYVAKAVAAQTAFLGLLGRLPGWFLVALTAPPLLLLGVPLASVATLLAVQSAVIWAFKRSGSLLVPAALTGLLAIMAIDAARLTVWLKLGATGTLAGLPPVWAGLGVLALAALVLVLTTTPKAELARLYTVGRDWLAPRPDGRPRPLWPMVSVGLLWGVLTYIAGDLTYWAVTAVLPQTEPAPEILKRMLSMPLDVIAFNFVIVAALEEWVFRKGVFKPLLAKLKGWFWPAAILSSVIFSAVHFIDMGFLIDSELAQQFAGAYAWSWAGFLARVAAGIVLAFAYFRSGVLLIPMVAHFLANSMESVGLRFGVVPFLATAALVLVLQAVKKR